MLLNAYEFRSPAALMRRIDQRVRLEVGTVHVALVHRPSTDQRLVDIRRLETPALIDGYDEAGAELRGVVADLAIPRTAGPPEHAVMTVVARSGLCVFGPNESHWLQAWRYSNHVAPLITGDVIVITEHGWTDFMTQHAGHTPALAS